MVLAIAVGFALQHFLGYQQAPLFGFLVGLVVARLVPSPKSCPLPGRPQVSDREGAGPDSEGAKGDHAGS